MSQGANNLSPLIYIRVKIGQSLMLHILSNRKKGLLKFFYCSPLYTNTLQKQCIQFTPLYCQVISKVVLIKQETYQHKFCKICIFISQNTVKIKYTLSVSPALTAYISITKSRILINLGEDVGTFSRHNEFSSCQELRLTI